jgi:PAS domain S-box-containing protein
MIVTDLRVLILEDQIADAELSVLELQREGFNPLWKCVDTEAEFRREIGQGYEVILADFSLPHFNALRALDILRESEIDVPFIIVSGSLTDAGAIEAVKRGATDYLLKDRLARLGPAVQGARREKALRDEKRRTQAALEASEARFRRLAARVPDVIFRYVWRPERYYEYINDAALRVFGYRPEAFYADPFLFQKFIHPDDLPALQKLRIEQGFDQPIRVRCIRKDGTIIWIEDYSTGEYDEQGRLVATEGIVRDITARIEAEKKANNALLEAKRLEIKLEKERELSELKSRFIAMASHEFRTPLTVIFSSSEVLRLYSERLTDGHKLEHLDRIQRAVGQLTGLMDDVLVMGRMEADRMPFEPALIDLEEACRDMIHEMSLTLKTKHQLAFEASGICNPAVIDTKLLRQVLNNVVTNAVKYSPEESGVEITLTCEDDVAVIQVRDHGIGIPEGDQARLFDSFYRGSNTGQIPGTGLGLAIAKTSVEMHGGLLYFTSVVGEGTTFTIELPLTPWRTKEQNKKGE